MFNKILQLLNKKEWVWFLSPIITVMYLIKGMGWVKVKYHTSFRAWAFKVDGIVYLSPGPGWVYSFGYLNGLLDSTYCKFYRVKEGDCVIDLGAGLGEETAVFAQLVGTTGKVFALEANPVVCKALRYLSESNKFTQVHVSNVAISSKEGVVEIEDNLDIYVGNTVNAAGVQATQGKCFIVSAISLDKFVELNEIEKVDLLKVNIEGAEQFLIQGLKESLPKFKIIAISCHDFRFHNNGESEFYATKNKVIKFMVENGFEVKVNITGHPVNDYIVYGLNKNWKF